MNNTSPLVSLILPVHNDENSIVDCLKSLRRQSYKKIEIIAIDDKSTDQSYRILKSVKKQNKKFKVFRNIKHYGIVVTLNRAIKKAKGDYIGIISTRDTLHRDRIKRQISYLKKNPEIVALGTQCIFVNKKNRKLGKSDFPLQNKDIYSTSPLHGIFMQFETTLIRKSLLPKDILKFSGSVEPFIYSDFLIKLLPYGKFENLTAVLQRHRKNPNDFILDLRRNIFSLFKLWIKSLDSYDYQISIRSIFNPILGSFK